MKVFVFSARKKSEGEEKYRKSEVLDGKLEVLDSLSGQQKFWTHYLNDIWRYHDFNDRF